MNTLYDFVTHVKGIEYLLSVTFIAGYVLFWETLKAKPFQSNLPTGPLLRSPWQSQSQLVKRLVAPFSGLKFQAFDAETPRDPRSNPQILAWPKHPIVIHYLRSSVYSDCARSPWLN